MRSDTIGSPRRARWGFLVLSFAGVVAVGFVDYFTGFQVRVYALYFVPLCLGAWFGNSLSTAGLVTICAFTWSVSNHLAGLRYDDPLIWPLNFLINATGFGTVGALVRMLRRSLDSERVMSRTDALTSLWNSRVMTERIDAEISRQRRSGRPFVLAYMDMDDFKKVNDLLGHSSGDNLLRAIGERLRTGSRATDTAARLGGDEFMLLLPETGIDEGKTVLARIHALLWDVLAGSVPGTGVSIGAVSFEGVQISTEEAIRLADSVMYEVKRSGRNGILLKTAAEVVLPSCEEAASWDEPCD